MDLTDKEKEVLYLLVRKGLKTRYDLFKKDGGIVSSSTAHRLLVDLKEKRLIEVKKEEAFRIRGRKKKLYGLTLKGLATAFKATELSKQIDKIAEEWGALLPLVVGKWDHFKSYGLEKEFMEAFKWVVMWILEWGHDREDWAQERFWYYIFQMTFGDKKVKWLKALRIDPELRQWAIEWMRRWLAEGRMFMKMHEQTLQVLKMKGEPNWDTLVSDLLWHPGRLEKELEQGSKIRRSH